MRKAVSMQLCYHSQDQFATVSRSCWLLPRLLQARAATGWSYAGETANYFPLNRGTETFIFATTPQPDWTQESWTMPGDVAELRAVGYARLSSRSWSCAPPLAIEKIEKISKLVLAL